MIIVSQDKKRTIENLNLAIRDSGEYNQNYTIYNTITAVDLAEYKTEERAKEVLQEITERYTNWENFKAGQPEGICSPKYEMPKE